jgi:exopolysaccharide biosynthesis polyprenyl glycosylphosphotransferase
MYQQQVNIINGFRMFLDALSIIAAGYAAYFLILHLAPEQWQLNATIFVMTILAIMFTNNYVMGRFRLYSDRKPSSYLQLIGAIAKTMVVDFAILSAGILLFNELYTSRAFFMYFLGLSFVFLVIERTLLRLLYDIPLKREYNLRRILIAGDLERGMLVAELMQKQLSWGHEIVGRLSAGKDIDQDALGRIDDLDNILHKQAIDEVIFALDRESSIDLAPYLKICSRMGITTRILPALWSPGTRALTVEICQGVPFLTFQENNFNATGLLYKRILDIIGGIVGSLILLIVYPFVALAIKIDSPGPVIFKQKRVGQHGRIFEVYKFRSMHVDAEERKNELMAQNLMHGAIFKMKNDPRITRVGRWLRKTSIDEIPQFLNVLKGEMSLVGTRPPTLDEVEHYLDWHYRRISAKPGITGLWQVSGRNKITDFDEIVELDCAYLENWRFLVDIKILLKTIWVVLKRKGAV